jgi:hypothetical protein
LLDHHSQNPDDVNWLSLYPHGDAAADLINDRAQADRGAYMMTATPTRQMRAPAMS